MNDVFLRSVQSCVSLYGALYILTAIIFPGWFLDHMSINDLDRRKVWRWRLWLQTALAFVGIATLIYSAAYAVIAVVPYSLGSHDEDGDWQPARETVRFFLTLVSSICLIERLEENAELLIDGPHERAVRLILLDAIVSGNQTNSSIVKSTIEKLEKRLSHENLTGSIRSIENGVNLLNRLRGVLTNKLEDLGRHEPPC